MKDQTFHYKRSIFEICEGSIKSEKTTNKLRGSVKKCSKIKF